MSQTADAAPSQSEPTGRRADGSPGSSSPPALVRAVVGLQWGDEGKGKAVDQLARQCDAVVRYNGGANAGHSVVVGGERFALHLMPSGILTPGVLCVIGNGVVVDPEQLIREMDALGARGIDVSGLRISGHAHVVLPYHKLEDELRERLLTQHTGGGLAGKPGSAALGTTKRGIGPCYADKIQRATAVRMLDLRRPEVLRSRIELACRVKSAMFAGLAPEQQSEWRDAVNPEWVLGWIATFADRLAPLITDTGALVRGMVDSGKRVLMEGANAALLDVDHGTYPFVTSSSTTACGIPSGAGLAPRHVGDVIGVVKAYSTRVGAGPMPTELQDSTGERLRAQGHEFGTTTGRPRRCGWLDLVAVKYAAELNGVSELCLTKLDVLTGFDRLPVCTGYLYADGKTDAFVADGAELETVEPVYEELDGWGDASLASCRSFADLPEAARRYVEWIESFVGVRVGMIGVGPGREETIVCGT